MNNKFKQFILLAGDIAVLYLSLYLTLLIRYWQAPADGLWEAHFIPFTFIFFIWILVFYIAGLYNLHLAVNNADFFKLALRGIAAAGLLSLAFFYLSPQTNIAPKRNLLIYIAVFAALFCLWRRIYNGLLKSYLPQNNIAVIGLNSLTKELALELAQKPHLGQKIVFIVSSGNENEFNGIPVIKKTDDLKNLIKEKNINTVILAANPNESSELRSSLFKCLRLKINYVSLWRFYENLTGKIPVESLTQMWFLENLSEGNKGWFDAFKRAYDIVLAILVLSLTAPFWPIIALAVKLESRGPAFFRQTRVGINGKHFQILKFRSMAETGNDASPAVKNDKRVTKVGSFLRKTRLDEIPQAINILKGEMSFVGPRPERPEFAENLEKQIPFYKERTLVKPGITGWDQVSGEYHSPSYEDSLKKLQYDLFYIKNRSIYLDLSIILKTISTVLSRKGI